MKRARAGADEVVPGIIDAVISGNLDGVKRAVARGESVDCKYECELNGRKGFASPLILAAVHNRVEICRYLVGRDADVRVSFSITGPTGLGEHALEGFGGAIVAAFYRPAAGVAANGMGGNALHYAAEKGNAEILDVLLKEDNWSLFIDKQNAESATPLHLAAYHGHEACVRALLKAGVDLDIATNREPKMTASDFAKAQGHRNIVRLIEAEREKRRDSGCVIA